MVSHYRSSLGLLRQLKHWVCTVFHEFKHLFRTDSGDLSLHHTFSPFFRVEGPPSDLFVFLQQTKINCDVFFTSLHISFSVSCTSRNKMTISHTENHFPGSLDYAASFPVSISEMSLAVVTRWRSKTLVWHFLQISEFSWLRLYSEDPNEDPALSIEQIGITSPNVSLCPP